MALGATLYRASIALSDVDRAVYESLDLRAALHPSETMEHLVLRIIAYALYFEPGIAFSAGLSTGDEPPIAVADTGGRIRVWIEVGNVPLERLKRAARSAETVMLLTTRDPAELCAEAAATPASRYERVTIERIDPVLVRALVGSLEKRHGRWELTRTSDTLYITTDAGTSSSAIEKTPLVAAPR